MFHLVNVAPNPELSAVMTMQVANSPMSYNPKLHLDIAAEEHKREYLCDYFELLAKANRGCSAVMTMRVVEQIGECGAFISVLYSTYGSPFFRPSSRKVTVA